MKTERNIILGIVLLTVVIFAGAIFFLSGTPASNTAKETPAVSKGDIISGNGFHWHPTLTIYIDGEKQEIPENVGLGAVHLPIHTHDDANEDIIHMEFSGQVVKKDTRLGNFFKTWEKEFNKNQIFDKKNTGEKKVLMTINGKKSMAFENYEMKDGDKIEIHYE